MSMHLGYFGTYTDATSLGIYAFALDSHSGKLESRGIAAETVNPSFLAIHSSGRYVYAVNETNTGSVSAFRRKSDSLELEKLNEQPSGGGAPCHLVLDATERFLLVANYSGGNVSVTKIKPDGSLGEQTAFVQHSGSSVNERRQKTPHAHSINVSPNNRWALVADLGTDQVIVYAFDQETGKLVRHDALDLPPGSGPRHLAFNPNSSHAYVINELLSTIAVCDFDQEKGKLTNLQTIQTLPQDYEGDSTTAEVRVSSDGRFVYGSNRGHDSIAVLRVEPDQQLLLVQIESIGGKTPRNFNLDPTGKFLLAAAQGTDQVFVLRRDENTGKLSKVAKPVDVPNPVCIRFLPSMD